MQRDFCYYELKSNHINFDNFSNSIRVHISALRKKLRAALGYDPIRNRIGEGRKRMKKLSLQWRITLMTALLIGATCVFMNVLIGYSGSRYMDSIGSYVTGYGDTDKGEPDFFDPEHEKLDRELTIVINGAQESFITTNWYITAVATLLGGVLAYFLSGHALKPLRTFTARVEKVQPNNLTDMKITEEVLPEMRQFVKSFNLMLDRLDEGFTAQRQFAGNG